MAELIKGAEPFFIKKGEVGCLLVHGFTGTPNEHRELGDYLAERDITVHAPLQKGHGTSHEDLLRTTWQEWHEDVKKGLAELKQHCKTVFVCGLSMGGLQTLYLAQMQTGIKGIVSLSAPVYIKNPKVTLLMPLLKISLVKQLYRYDKGVGDDLKDPEARQRMICYKKVPTWAVLSLFEFMDTVREGLPKVSVPILIMQGKDDHVVHPGNGQFIYDHVSSTDKQLIMLDNSYHVITMDYDKKKVFESVHGFIAKHVP